MRFRPALEPLENRAVPATLHVTTPLDVVNPNDGVLSLREAIAEAAPSGDTIDFNLGTNAQTVVLKGMLLIEKSLSIQGPGAGQLAISGNQQFAIFDVGPGVQVSLAGMTIRDGEGSNAFEGTGGAIRNYGTLTVSACSVSNNRTYGAGAGIYNAGTLTVTGSTLSGNRAYELVDFGGYGGGIYNTGTLTVSNSHFSANHADFYGGAIYNHSTGVVTIAGSALSGNSAQQGGAIYSAGAVSITSSELNWNVADSVGGAIHNSGNMSISACTLSQNTAGWGGAILNAAGSTLTVKASKLTKNWANRGGGIYNDADASLEVLDRSTVAQNQASLGTDLFNLGSFTKDKTSKVAIIGP